MNLKMVLYFIGVV